MSQYKGPTTLVLGWDAGCWEYLNPLLEAGDLPTLRGLMNKGAFGDMVSTQPPMTPVAWSTIFTGCGPGKHGIFNWWHTDLNDYKIVPYSFADIAVESLFSYVSRSNVRIGIVNVPLTEPAPSVNGFILGGISHPAHTYALSPQSTFPPQLKDEIHTRHHGFREFRAQFEAASSDGELLDAWRRSEAERLALVKDLVTQFEPELLWVHCHIGDYFGHRVGRDSEVLRRALMCIDNTLANLIDLSSDDATTLVVSDHGQAEIETLILIQNWLEREGLLTFNNDVAPANIGNTTLRALSELGIEVFEEELEATLVGLSQAYYDLPTRIRERVADLMKLIAPGCTKSHDNINWKETKAYCTGFYGQIRLNVQGREANGTVPPAEYEELVRHICARLAEIKNPHTQKPVGVVAFPRNEVYEGAAVETAPDIVCTIPDTSYYFCPIHSLHLYETADVAPVRLDELKKRFRFHDWSYRGDHSLRGFYVLSGPRVSASGRTPEIQAVDVAPLLLQLLGLQIPAHMDGTVRSDLIHARSPARPTSSSGQEANDSAVAPAQVLEHLRGLGYRL
jgi:predicted AlkP superfamily phosphohydrolase/phosphomutase